MFLVLSYLIAQGVCYLSLCEASFPKKMVFAYLDELHSEFYEQYGKKVPSVTRPYSFIEFGKTGLHEHSRKIASSQPHAERIKPHFYHPRHVYPENKEVLHRQQGQEEPGQY